jgi:hypothetical protein
MDCIQWLRDRLVYTDCFALALLLAGAFIQFLPYPQATTEDITLLRSGPMAQSCGQAIEQRHFLGQILNRKAAMVVTAESTREQMRMQARVSYCAILAGAVALMARRNARARRNVAAVALVVILLLYGIDVHLKVLIARTREVLSVYDSTEAMILLTRPTDSSWHTLDAEALKSLRGGPPSDVRERKIRAFVHPDLEEWIYYFIPFVGFYFSATRLMRLQKRRSTQSDATHPSD